MLSPATTQASRKAAACRVSVPSSTSSDKRFARTTNLRMLTAVKVTTGGSPPPIPCSRAISLISPGEIDVALGDLAVVVAYQLHAHKRIGQGHVWMVVGSLGGLSDRGDEAEADDEVAGKEPRVGGWASLRQSSSPARRGSACWSFSISSACDWTDRRAFGDHGGSG